MCARFDGPLEQVHSSDLSRACVRAMSYLSTADDGLPSNRPKRLARERSGCADLSHWERSGCDGHADCDADRDADRDEAETSGRHDDHFRRAAE